MPLDVTIVRPLGRGGKGGIDRVVDNEIATIDTGRIRISESVTRGSGSILLSPFHLVQSLAGIALRKARGKVALVHVNLSSHGSVSRKMPVMALCRALKIPYTIHLHGSRFRQYWDGLAPAASARLSRAFEAAACVYVLGDVWRDYVHARTPGARIEILFNGTPAPEQTHAHHKGEKPVHILFLGRLGARKGTPELVQAFARMRAMEQAAGMANEGTHPLSHAWRATIAGDGDVAQCRADVETSALSDRVAVTGWMGPEDVERLLGEADVLTLPSHDENLPMSVIEAMGHGLAVVTTPVGATASIIHDGHTGLLVPPGEDAPLAEALFRVVRDADLRARLGAAARAFHAAHLDIRRHTETLTNSWEHILGVDAASDTPSPTGKAKA